MWWARRGRTVPFTQRQGCVIEAVLATIDKEVERTKQRPRAEL